MNPHFDTKPVGAQWEAQAMQQHGGGPKPTPPKK